MIQTNKKCRQTQIDSDIIKKDIKNKGNIKQTNKQKYVTDNCTGRQIQR